MSGFAPLLDWSLYYEAAFSVHLNCGASCSASPSVSSLRFDPLSEATCATSPSPSHADALCFSCCDTFRVYVNRVEGQMSDTALPVGGQSSMSFALCAKLLHQRRGLPLIAIDLRGHGATSTHNDTDLSHETAVTDVYRVLQQLFSYLKQNGQQPHQTAQLPSFVLAGHSLGAALAIRLASSSLLTVSGLICIDLVEESAVRSIPFTRAAISSRVQTFDTLENAIEWSVRSRMIRNVESARISIPAQIKRVQLADNVPSHYVYAWRTPLGCVEEEQWHHWYSNLSEVFLSQKQPKLLLIADVDRLDSAMSVAQMQGRLQIKVIRLSGHNVPEDNAVETAESIGKYCDRYWDSKAVAKMMALNLCVTQPAATNYTS